MNNQKNLVVDDRRERESVEPSQREVARRRHGGLLAMDPDKRCSLAIAKSTSKPDTYKSEDDWFKIEVSDTQ